jgi:hypothetical protein
VGRLGAAIKQYDVAGASHRCLAQPVDLAPVRVGLAEHKSGIVSVKFIERFFEPTGILTNRTVDDNPAQGILHVIKQAARRSQLGRGILI